MGRGFTFWQLQSLVDDLHSKLLQTCKGYFGQAVKEILNGMHGVFSGLAGKPV
jgi:hypothetical protein